MIQHSLIEDLSTLTTIPNASLQSLADKAAYCICDCIEEATLGEDNAVSLKLGFGTLKIEVVDDNVLYRFEPSRELEESVNQTFLNHKNPLVTAAETTLVKRIVNTYKDFL